MPGPVSGWAADGGGYSHPTVSILSFTIIFIFYSLSFSLPAGQAGVLDKALFLYNLHHARANIPVQGEVITARMSITS